MEVEDIVQSKIKTVQQLPCNSLFHIFSLYGVDCGLNNCPGALGGEEAVQELGEGH